MDFGHDDQGYDAGCYGEPYDDGDPLGEGLGDYFEGDDGLTLDPLLVVTPEDGEPVEAPASYFLDNWYGHSTAERVIQECMEYGTPGTWDTPQGVMMVRRA